jgi:hypothetical protein
MLNMFINKVGEAYTWYDSDAEDEDEEEDKGFAQLLPDF